MAVGCDCPAATLVHLWYHRASAMPTTPRISVVVPVRDEQKSVAELTRLLEHVLVRWYEVIFVDDGSSDLTWEKLKVLHDPGRIRLLRLSRPCGKTAALMAGFKVTRGEIVITMDGDLQDDPKEIPRFLDRLAGGADLVCGWKKKRRDPVTKVVASRIFNLVVGRLTGLGLHDMNCGFKAFRGDVARSLHFYGEMHRFLPAMVAAHGYRVTEIEVTHHARKYGRSKYGVGRLLKGFLDLGTVLLLTRFEERPAHGFGLIAATLATLGGLLGAGYLVLASPLWLAASVVSWIAAAIFLASGWVAEVLLAAAPQAARFPYAPIAEKLD